MSGQDLAFKKAFLTSYAGILHLSHFIFKKKASHALSIRLCRILTGHC
jgi:hypothetical protein